MNEETVLFGALAAATYFGVRHFSNGNSNEPVVPNFTIKMPTNLSEAATSARTLSTGPQHTRDSGGTSGTTTGNMSAEGETTDIYTRSMRRRLFAGVD